MNKKLWENLISLYGLQVLNNLVPIVTLPFLARTLGSAHWGALAFAEAVANYASLIVEYGFGLSATRELGRLRDDPTARATQLASVLGAQLLLAGVALATGVSIVTQVRTLAQYRSLLPWAFLLAVTRSMVPIWYFQGLEQVRVIAAITISTNMVAALGILFLVRSPDQSWLPLALRTAASSASLVAGLMLAYRVTPFLAPRLATSASALRQGFPLFIFRSATSMYTTANVLLLGLMAPPSVVALFAGAEKISRAAIAAVWPITQAFYPRISYLLSNDPRNASKTARLSVLLTLSAGAAASIAIFLGAPLLVRLLLGHGFEGSTPILRLFALLPVLMASSNVFGIQWMLPLRMDRTFNCILVAAGVVNLGLACILVPLAQQTGMAVSVVTAEAVVTASIIVVLMRRKMAPWDELPMEGESIIRPTTPSLPMSV